MAPKSKHTINKYQFDVVLQNEKDFPEISQVLIDLFYEELHDEMDKIFSDPTIPPELIITLNQIEIDLGNISKDNLVSAFKSKFITELGQYIKRAILTNQGVAKNSIHISAKELELIRYYLRLGTLPWWSSILMNSLDSIFKKLILSEPVAVKQLVFDEAIDPIPRSRIINQFRDPTIYALFGIISTQPADYYKDYTDNLIAINQQAKITNEGDIKYKKVIQDLTFIYLLDQKGTSINQYKFFKNQIIDLAQKYDIEYFALVQQIYISSQQVLGVKENIRTPIVSLAKTLYEEEILLERTEGNKEEKLKLSQKIVEELLTRGSSSLSHQKIGFTNRDEIFQWLARMIPKSFVERYRALGKEWAVRDRTINLFDDTSLGVLFEKAAPQKKPLVFEVFEILETIQEEISPINQEYIAFKKVIRHFALELLVFQDLNTMTDVTYFQRQIQMFSKKNRVSELEILDIFEEVINQLKSHKRGYRIIKRLLNQSKQHIDYPHKREKTKKFSNEGLSNVFEELKKHYSPQILKRLEKNFIRYLKIYTDQRNIYLFIVKELQRLTGEDPIKIIDKKLSFLGEDTKRALIQKAHIDKTAKRERMDFVPIDYLIDLLKETPLKDWILTLEEKEAKAILIEIIYERGGDLLEMVEQQKYNIYIPKILAEHLDLVEFRMLIKQFRPEKFHVVLEFFEKMLLIQERWKIGRTSKNQFELFLKEQVIRFIQSGKKEEIEFFVLDKMKQDGLLNYKNLTFFRDFIDYSEDLWPIQSIANLILDNGISGGEAIKTIQKNYLQDIVLHYLAHGVIPQWVEKGLYEIETMRLFFNTSIKEDNGTFAHQLSEVFANYPYSPRIFEWIENGAELQFFKWLEKVPRHHRITDIISELRKSFAPQDSKKLDKRIFEAIVQYQIWLIPDKKVRISILQHILLNEGFKMDSNQIIRDEWLFIYEFLSGRQKQLLYEEESLKRSLEKIRKHPLRFYEQLKKIPNPTSKLIRIFQQIPKELLIQWFLMVLDRGIFPVRVKNYGNLSVQVFKRKGQKKDLERYLAIFLVYLLFSEPSSNYRIKRFFEEVMRLPKEVSSEILELFLKANPSEKKSLWTVYSRQVTIGNTYQLPERLKSDWVLFLHYLQYGSIPLAGDRSIGLDVLRVIVLKFLAEAPTFMRIKLHRLLRTNVVRKNFSRLLQSVDVPIIMKLIHPDLANDWNELSDLIKKSSLNQSLRASLGWMHKMDELESILKVWVKGSNFLRGTAEIIAPIVKAYAKKERIEANLLIGLVGAKEGEGGIKVIRELDNLLKIEIKRETKIGQEPNNRVEEEESEKTGIHINNAGLALLWPFLGRYFKRLNMIKDGDFISEELRMRGVQLTQYLVTGKTEIEESELALNKLLCGAEKDLVIEYDLDVSSEEIALSASLLQGAIYNWEKMRGTRIETFRQTFLHRGGILRKTEEYFELKVEEKSYDMLLTTLPWNLSMIKLAWMKSRLTVIWK